MHSLVYLISHMPDSRYKKRFDMLNDICDQLVVYWNKKGSQGKALSNYTISSYEIPIKANETSPFKRLPQWYSFAKKGLKKIIEETPNVIYVGNFDMLAIAWIYKKFHNKSVKVVYEIADLHRYIVDANTFSRKVLKFILISIEKRLVRCVDLLVLTSDKFFDEYYCRYFTKDQVVLLPNMPDKKDFQNYVKKSDGKFTVGFVGSVRYKNQLKMLIDAAAAANINVLFAGAEEDGNEIETLCTEHSDYCAFLGAYNYSDEIANIYSKIDCVYSVYDADMNNVKVALPNKLYESIICELPIIVAKNTYLEELVNRWSIGVAVSHTDAGELTQVLKKLAYDHDYYNNFVQGCRENKSQADSSIYISEFKKRISELA